MKNATKIFVVGALATSGFLAFACGGGSSEGGGATTPSASAPAASSVAATSEPTTTATSTPQVATTAAVPAGPPLTVAAMKLVGPNAKHTIEMKDDGSVLGDGKPIAKFVGATLQDAEGKPMVSVAADGSIAMTGQTSKTAKFNDKDELVISDGAKMTIGDDGVVKLFNPDGKADKDSGKMKLTGFKPAARRAATVFVLAMMMSSPEHTTTTSASSAAPVVSAKPASTAKK
jgi:hypothetical protein